MRQANAIAFCVCSVCVIPTGFPVDCLPPQEATNKIAAAIAKAKKQAGTSADGIMPFPFVELGDFLPDWAGVRCSHTRYPPSCMHCYIFQASPEESEQAAKDGEVAATAKVIQSTFQRKFVPTNYAFRV